VGAVYPLSCSRPMCFTVWLSYVYMGEPSTQLRETRNPCFA
jgi:hypothetical protein